MGETGGGESSGRPPLDDVDVTASRRRPMRATSLRTRRHAARLDAAHRLLRVRDCKYAR